MYNERLHVVLGKF